MAESSAQNEPKANTAAGHGDHDRVAMLSLHPDGSPAQHEPEIVGDKDFALAATRRQFAEQAVSAVDVEERGGSTGPVTLVGQKDGSTKSVPEITTLDPSVAELAKKHEAAEKAAEKAADATVGKLFAD